MQMQTQSAGRLFAIAVTIAVVVAALVWGFEHTSGDRSARRVSVTPAATAPSPPVITPESPNPAAQKAGPPDPVAQQSAADSAQNAAEAAAKLAAAGNATN